MTEWNDRKNLELLELVKDYAEATVRIRELMATNAALVEAMEAAVEAMEFAYMNAPKQPKEIEKARAALKLAKGE